MALLAFDATPSNSPDMPTSIAELLHPSQRVRTANELNAAILKAASQSDETKLTQLARLMCWGEGLLSEKVAFPQVEFEAMEKDVFEP